MRIILASNSPRRKELLNQLFTNFEVIPAKGTETYTEHEPAKIVQQLAAQKAAETCQAVYGQNTAEPTPTPNSQSTSHPDALVIGADTIVAFQGQILGKPRDAAQAKEMLKLLAGNVHQVYTGVALIVIRHGTRQCIQFSECTNVQFYPMSAKEIEAYVQSGEPMDKAGAYGIQGIGGRFVEGIEGDYQNVVGLPVAKLYQVFKKIDEIALPF